ncbi:unnamed protein product [Camellia sinensis]
MGRGMGHLISPYVLTPSVQLFIARVFSLSLTTPTLPPPLQIRVKHRKQLEFQYQKQSCPAISLALNTVLQRGNSTLESVGYATIYDEMDVNQS